MSKRKEPGETTIIIHDLWTSHTFLAPNEYSSATIGIHNCLLRCCENEHFAKFFYQGIKMNLQTRHFIDQLDNKEKFLSNKGHLDIERCVILARLRKYLKQDQGLFQKILDQIQNHLYQCMQEDSSLSPPERIQDTELIQQCNQRNDAALKLHRAHRMRRFQFHDGNDSKQLMNVINLQKWISNHFKLFLQMTSESSIYEELHAHLKTLLNNSFLIIQHPSPSVVTHSPVKKGDVTAKLNCRLLCLLDRSNPAITIDNITPVVRHVTASNQMEEPDVSYEQSQISWETCTIVTASVNYRNFFYADLSEIILKQKSSELENQKSTTRKTHYAPYVYRIDFQINVTVRLPNNSKPFQYTVPVESAPFGVISHTSQEADLFAKVFIQDLKSWRSLSTPLPLSSTISNNITFSLTTTDLTINEIVNSIQRYFIHKTGIPPKYWIMPYIKDILSTACHNKHGSLEDLCHDHLVKILAQINYMAEHPLLSLFHADGLFLAICDSDVVSQMLLNKRDCCQVSVCAMRFGALSRMSDPKDVGVRVDLVERSSTKVQNYKFNIDKLSFELGLYIIKIALCEASRFDNILTNLYTNVGGYDQNVLENITKFVELYDSAKLREICPHEERYLSIWNHFHHKENDSSLTSNLSSNFTITTTTEANADNIHYDSWNSSICTIDQTQLYGYQPVPLQQYYPQPQASFPSEMQVYGAISNVPQYSIAPQINQTNINSSPIIIVVSHSNHLNMSDQDVKQLISNRLPQYSHLIESSFFHRIDADQTFNVPIQTSQTLLPNSTSYETFLNFPCFDNHSETDMQNSYSMNENL